jgi:hypothetical protein
MVRTATAEGKLFMTEQVFSDREILVQFVRVSDRLSHSAEVRFHTSEASVISIHMLTVPLASLNEVDQETAKTIWLLQTGEEL